MRLIDVDDLIAELEWLYSVVSDKTTVNGVIKRVNAQPIIDATIVTRCKDCKHCLRTKDLISHNPDALWCQLGFYQINENDFCSKAERRTE